MTEVILCSLLQGFIQGIILLANGLTDAVKQYPVIAIMIIILTFANITVKKKPHN